MTEQLTQWDGFLALVRATPLVEDLDTGRALASLAADWLAPSDPFPASPSPAAQDASTFEPYVTLLRAYQRLNRALSQVLYERSYHEDANLLASEFGDWAVGSLARESYLDLELAAAALLGGSDLQAMCLLRQMAELSWRALVLAGEPAVADEWWETLLVSTETGERHKLDKRLWAKHFRPAQLLRGVAVIEARLDGRTGEAAGEHEREAIAHLGAIYTLLSGTAHGGTDLVYASAVRGRGGRLPADPFELLGEPTELGLRLVRAALYLQYRFWHYFQRAAFPPSAPGEGPVALVPPPRCPDAAQDPEESSLLLAMRAVDLVVERHFGEYLRAAAAR
jgi:hypothetical protein